MTLTEVLIDFSMISVFLMIGAWLRRKIKLLQIYYVPVSLIAGILGLLLGPQVGATFATVGILVGVICGPRPSGLSGDVSRLYHSIRTHFKNRAH